MYFSFCFDAGRDGPAPTDFSVKSAAVKPHKNTRYPELQDKEALEALTRQFGTPSRIAKHLGCSKSTASYAMRKAGVKPRNFVADERVLAGLGVR